MTITLRPIFRVVSIGVAMLLNIVAFGYLAILALLAIQQHIAPRSSGIFALIAIFFPFVFVAAIPLIPFALVPRTWVLRLSLPAILAVYLFGVGFGGHTLPNSLPAGSLSVVSWNILADNTDTATIRQRIRDANAAIVGIQELRHEQAAALEADVTLVARYPHRILVPDGAYAGVGLLSAYPILDSGVASDPPAIWARIDVSGRQILVVNAHPFPGAPTVRRVGPLPIPTGFDPAGRDVQITAVLDLLTRVQQPGEPVVLIGDFNVTEREAAYRQLTANLTDAQLAAGFGPGASWKTTDPRIWRIPLGMLRIDYQLSSGIRPLRAGTDCHAAGSDHCPVRVDYAF